MFTVENGMLTPTFKIKRNVVKDRCGQPARAPACARAVRRDPGCLLSCRGSRPMTKRGPDSASRAGMRGSFSLSLSGFYVPPALLLVPSLPIPHSPCKSSHQISFLVPLGPRSRPRRDLLSPYLVIPQQASAELERLHVGFEAPPCGLGSPTMFIGDLKPCHVDVEALPLACLPLDAVLVQVPSRAGCPIRQRAGWQRRSPAVKIKLAPPSAVQKATAEWWALALGNHGHPAALGSFCFGHNADPPFVGGLLVSGHPDQGPGQWAGVAVM
eukprot:351395-Chlamydomonas_euryale.AAC.3